MNQPASAPELLVIAGRGAADIAHELNESEAAAALPLWQDVAARARAAMVDFSAGGKEAVDFVTSILMQLTGASHIEERITLLSAACFYYQRIGRGHDGIRQGSIATVLAHEYGYKNLERRANNDLSIAYISNADFEQACNCLERSLVLARELGDPFLEHVAITNTVLLLKEMGLYADAIEVADKALSYNVDTPQVQHLRFANAGNGLFCAHRLRDDVAALRYMTIGSETLDNPLVDWISRAAFETSRAAYLRRINDNETAELLIASARERAANVNNPRVEILLDIAFALCEWASCDPMREARARKQLRELYHRSKQSHLYHDDVLRALIDVHGRHMTGETDDLDMKTAKFPGDFSGGYQALMRIITETANIGMKYAKELVEYTTGVKHAKFYRQMNDKAAALQAAPDHQAADPFDPFVSVRRWLSDDSLPELAAPIVGVPVSAPAPVPANDKNEIRKHDELTAIHGDLAQLRIESLKATIRTAAYDVAENWALAAEFFDDQTGQHCFRVGRLASMLAAEVGMEPDYCLRIDHAARLHDIGKIAVNEMVLLKPGPLDSSELTAMQAHTEVGAQLLQEATDPTLQMAAAIARYHHAWWNGAGYPGTSGENIPLEARICALADVYDALTNVRPYKRAWSHRMAIEQMMCENGAHFDPRLMRPFLKVLERHVGSTAQPPSTQLHLKDMEANGLLTSRRKLMLAVKAG